MNLVRFSCGCIGFAPVDGFSYMVDACDSDDGHLSLFKREVGTKDYTPLPQEFIDVMAKNLSRLIIDGYRAREIQSLLKSVNSF